MKKYFLIILLTFMLFPVLTFAQTHNIQDLKIKFDDDWIVFTRENIEDEEYLKKYNVSYSLVKDILSNNIYLDASLILNNNDTKDYVEMFVGYVDSTLLNINLLKDDDIKKLENQLVENLKDYKVDNHGIYKTDNTIYVYIEYKDKGFFVKDYYTIINNKSYTLKFQSSQAFNDEKNKIVKSVINEAIFDYDISNEQVIDLNKEKKFNWNSVIRDALIGGAVGAVIGLAGFLIKKKTDKSDNFKF